MNRRLFPAWRIFTRENIEGLLFRGEPEVIEKAILPVETERGISPAPQAAGSPKHKMGALRLMVKEDYSCQNIF